MCVYKYIFKYMMLRPFCWHRPFLLPELGLCNLFWELIRAYFFLLTQFFTEGLNSSEMSTLSTGGLPSEAPPGENTSEASEKYFPHRQSVAPRLMHTVASPQHPAHFWP